MSFLNKNIWITSLFPILLLCQWQQSQHTLHDRRALHMTGYNDISKEFFFIGGMDNSLNFFNEYDVISLNLNSFWYVWSNDYWYTFDGLGYKQWNNKIYYIPGQSSYFGLYSFDMNTETEILITTPPSRHNAGYSPCIAINPDIGSGIIYVIGSKNSADYSGAVSQYNIGSNSWSVLDTLTHPRIGASCDYINGKIYVIGGWMGCTYSPNYCTYFNTIDKHNGNSFNLISDTLSQNIFNPRTVILQNEIYVIGGRIYNNGFDFTKTVHILNTVDDSVRIGPQLRTKRGMHSAVLVDNTIYVFGGRNLNNDALNTIETLIVTETPTLTPTDTPTQKPTSRPTVRPTFRPILDPTVSPTKAPTNKPSEQPTQVPSKNPTIIPTELPSKQPTEMPTIQPTLLPSKQPSKEPSNAPSNEPSQQPSNNPSLFPSQYPSTFPSLLPTVFPSINSTNEITTAAPTSKTLVVIPGTYT